MTVTVPAIPTPVPQKTDTLNFATRADALLAALPAVVTAQNLQNIENNAINVAVNDLQLSAVASAASAAAAAIGAAAARDIALAQAAIVAAQVSSATASALTAAANAATTTTKATEATSAANTTQALRDSFVAVYGSLGYQATVAYASGLSITVAVQTVEYAGEVYAPLIAALPFTTGAIFDTSKWRVVNATKFLSDAAGAVLRSLEEKCRDVVNIEDCGGLGGDAAFNNASALTLALAAAFALKRPLALTRPPYRLGSNVTISQDDITIIACGGTGDTLPLFKQTSTTANTLTVTGKGLRVIGRLSFAHTGTPTAGIALNVTGAAAGAINIDAFDAFGMYEAVKQSEGAGSVRIGHLRLRNILGQLAVWVNSLYSVTPKYNTGLTIDFVDCKNPEGVNNALNWFAFLQYGRDISIGRLGGVIEGGTDAGKCYCNNEPGVPASERWSERIYFGPIRCIGQHSDVLRIKEGDWVTVDRTQMIDATTTTVDLEEGGTFNFGGRGLFTSPEFGGNLRAIGAVVSGCAQHGIYLTHQGPGRTVLRDCESSDNSRASPLQSNNFIVDDWVSNFFVTGGNLGVPGNGKPASTKLTFTGAPNNAYTLTLLGQLLNFRTTATAATDIQLADTTRGCLINLVDFVNTSMLPQIRRLTATLDPLFDVVTFTLKERGLAGNSLAVSKAGSLMNFPSGTPSTTLLGGTGRNEARFNALIPKTCRNYRFERVDLQGGGSGNADNKGQGLFIDCPGVDNPTDVVMHVNVAGTVTNTTLRAGYLSGGQFEFVGYMSSVSAGTCGAQASINGVTQGGSAVSVSASQGVVSALPVAGGTGYTVNDTLTVTGGTSTSAATLKVATVDGSGRVLSVTVLNQISRYTVQPTDPVAVTGGTGTGATFNLGWSLGFRQDVSTPYRFDATSTPVPATVTITSASSAADLSVTLLFRRVTL